MYILTYKQLIKFYLRL